MSPLKLEQDVFMNVPQPKKVDMVNKPPHYTGGSIECIEAIEASMTPEEFKGFLKGTVMRYMWRYRLKWNPVEDLKKAMWYLNRLTSFLEKEKRDEEVLNEPQGTE